MLATYDVVQQCSEGSCGSTAFALWLLCNILWTCFATFYEHALQHVFEEFALFGGTLSHIMLANSHCAKKTNYHFKTNKLPVLMNKPFHDNSMFLRWGKFRGRVKGFKHWIQKWHQTFLVLLDQVRGVHGAHFRGISPKVVSLVEPGEFRKGVAHGCRIDLNWCFSLTLFC